jgi:hypothetical protein
MTNSAVNQKFVLSKLTSAMQNLILPPSQAAESKRR